MAAKGTSGSYYDDYMRSNAMLKHGGDRNAKQLLTDRSAYISFLEVQLERVSAACLSVQTFEKRLAEVEATQIANNQKISSLSKVFRLNQEYVEQTHDQARAELAAFAGKMDSWMEKYSTELQTHETRITESEEHMRRTDSFVESLSVELRQDVDSVKITLVTEVQDLKTLLFAAEARIEAMHTAHGDTDQHMEILRQIVTDRMDQDLERIRTTLSEKYIAFEQKHEELRENVKLFAAEIETGWKSDLARLTRSEDEKWKRARDRIDQVQQESETELHDVKEFLKKCLDAQHLLSTTVVGLQAEVDERGYSTATRHAAKAMNDADDLADAVDDLRRNQHTLKEALRIVQSCSREAQHSLESQCERLSDRLDSTEQQFARLTHESLSKADEMRTKVLVALGEVEQKLRHDADAAADNAVESVRSESKMYITQFLENVSRLEDRQDQLEVVVHELQSRSLTVKVPSVTKLSTPRHMQDKRETGLAFGGQELDVLQLTEAVARTVEGQIIAMVDAIRNDGALQTSRETSMKEYIHDLEHRLRRSTQRSEDHIPTVNGTTQVRKLSSVHPRHSETFHRGAKPPLSTSSSESTIGTRRIQATLPSKVTRRRPSSKQVNSTTVEMTGKAKNERLKELCLELVEMEGSLKSKTEGSSKPR